jgi:hypothetical protein
VHERVEGRLVGLPRRVDRLGAKHHARVASGRAHGCLDCLEDRLAIPAYETFHYVASARKRTFAGGDQRCSSQCYLRVIGERASAGQSEREVLHDEVVHIGRDPTTILS